LTKFNSYGILKSSRERRKKMKLFLLGMLIMYIIGWLCWRYEDLLENNGHYTPLPVILYEWPVRFFFTIIIFPIVFIYIKIKKHEKK
jgi:uncharacterized protein with PQ loop repeat